MADGRQELSIVIVPYSGTGQLTGISGTMAIRIVDGQHFYDIDYSLPEQGVAGLGLRAGPGIVSRPSSCPGGY